MQKGEDLIEKKDKELFDSIAEQYAMKDQILSSRNARRYQLEAALRMDKQGDQKVGRVFEIACGFGASAEYLKGRYDSYVGVDYSKELIRQARVYHRGNSLVKFLEKNVKEITPEDMKSADTILAVGALHHFTELEQVLDVIRSSAVPGSRFIAIEPQAGNPLVQLLRWIRGKVDRGYSEDQRFFTEKEIQQLFSKAGFRNVEIQYQGYFTPPLAQIPLHPQWFFAPLSKHAIAIDKFLDESLPAVVGKLSWNIIIRASI